MHSITILLTIKSGMQSIKIDGQDLEGYNFLPKITHLKCDSVLKSASLQLSNEPSLDKIGNKFSTFRDQFPTYYLKWSVRYDHSRKAVNAVIVVGGS